MSRGKQVTILDVAREAGVSITTVSRYLNQQYGAMSEPTQSRIKAVIETLDYHPNRFAQGLKRNRSQTVAVVVVNLSYPFCVSVIRTLSDILGAAGYSLMVAETRGDTEREHRLLQSLSAQMVDAIVMQTNGKNNQLVAEIASRIPVVYVDRKFSVPGVTDVITNNAEASEELAEALFREGYERILYVTEPVEDINTRIDRLRGYEAACMKARKAPWVTWVNRSNLATLANVSEDIVRQGPTNPFAVYTANGLIMQELYPLLRQLPYQVPGQMGIATFDEPDWAQIATPQLTCVRQPTTEIGEHTAHSILKSLRSKSVKRRIQQKIEVIPSQLLLNASTDLSGVR